MRGCRSCGCTFDERFRYCPWCGARQRLKIVEYFAAAQLSKHEENLGLRVSRYLAPPGHVRFSVWDVAEVKAAVSLDEDEAHRLARFLLASDPRTQPSLSVRLGHDVSSLLRGFRRGPVSKVGITSGPDEQTEARSRS